MSGDGRDLSETGADPKGERSDARIHLTIRFSEPEWEKGYPFSSFTPYILCLEPPAIWLYVSGSVSIACSSNR